jgi:carboxymethylenebutenolidase
MYDELKSLVPGLPQSALSVEALANADLSRRGFVVTTLTAGFAAAVQPVSAQTITTDTAGLEAGEVKIPLSDGELPAYRALPAQGTSFATVLVIQEIFGVHEHIKDICRRLAKRGYLAIAPELYARQGNTTAMTDVRQIMTDVVSKVPDEQVMRDLDATATWAVSNSKGDRARLAVTGFCWGGRMVWLYAAHSSNVKAGVAWYGRVAGPTNDLQPRHPIDLVGQLKAPVLGLYAGADEGIPTDTVERMRTALQNARQPSDIVLYDNLPHGFYADYRPTYRREAAEDGWNRMLDWFRRHGVASQ